MVHGKANPRAKTEIGWREMVALPDLGVARLRAKIDTGARTSALHAVDVMIFERNGERMAGFRVPVPGAHHWQQCSARVIDERPIKNTSGVPELRTVIETTLVLGRRHWRIELSLADRANMGFELILGRTSIRRKRLLVNPGASYLIGPPVTPPELLGAETDEGGHRTLARG